MNNDNEIMKEFNETFGNKPVTNVEPYQAKTNQNVVDGVNNNFNNVNSFNVNNNGSVNVVPEVNGYGNTFVNTQNNVVQENNFQPLYNTSDYINDSDRPVQVKQKKATIKINPEVKTALVLALILLIAMIFVPVIFDFIDDLKIKIFG